MVSILPTPLQNCCLHSTGRQCYLPDVQAWHYTHDVCCVDMVCTCSCLGNQDIHVKGRLVHNETWQRRNPVYKFHQPWKTLDTTRLLASFLVCCCKIKKWLTWFSKCSWTADLGIFVLTAHLSIQQNPPCKYFINDISHLSNGQISLGLLKTINENAFSNFEIRMRWLELRYVQK